MTEPGAGASTVARQVPPRAAQRATRGQGAHGAWGLLARALAALGVVAVAAGCGSTATQVGTAPPATSTAATVPLRQATPVSGLPATVSIADVAMSGSVAWVLTGPPAESLWRTTPSQAPKEVVDPSVLVEADLSGLSISGWANGLALMGFTCGADKPTIESCAPSTGVVELFDQAGAPIATTKLWSDGGGIDATPPRFLGADANGIWLTGPEKLYRLDANGHITETIERAGGDPCDLGGTIYQVRSDEPAPQSGKPLVLTNSSDTDLPAAPVNIRKWAGNEWENVADSSTSGAGPLPKVVCGGDRIDAFDASTLKMTWTPSAGWTKAPGSPDDPSPAGTAAGSAFPTFTDSGDVFWLTAANAVTWFDPRSGTLAPTGLTLLPGQADSPQNLRAARSGSSFFACVDRSVGLPGDTAKAPDPQCGFAPLPKK